ncbi:hypothetical protein TRFO_22595 [Tritrichomonas foetus]|uniref:Uncharacterized protein n=1 Tax=Tritrichomonas foetus TaxID=1144522 RepID=A0A1J4KBP3_9EUKA|nr:hypothetical protein TRFO_22595 [Tritrichomonas foetus]|eukprot:OHT08833.1 hypothetical protein TRFO_22595 [Tritrichomonas foetus]
MMDGDPNQTSTKVRNMAMRAIKESGRPITAHEYEQWLQNNENELWQEVVKKCYDYTRVILTNTAKLTLLYKYRCRQQMPGIDNRSVFYGLPNVRYDPELWQELNDKGRPKKMNRRRNIVRDDSMYDLPTSTSFSSRTPSPVIDQQVYIRIPEYIDSQIAFESWNFLSNHMQSSDPIWSQMMAALAEVRELVYRGENCRNIIEKLIQKYQSLQKSEIVNHCAIVFAYEAFTTQLSIDYAPIME